MKKRALMAFSLLLTVPSNHALPADRMQFWNLTGATIVELYLAAPGTGQWGPNQCGNDKDGSVDPDERLRLTSMTSGHYDVKIKDQGGRVCTVRNVAVESGKAYAFSLSESDLKDCGH